MQDGQPVDLLKGSVVRPAPQEPAHSDAVRRLGRRMVELADRFEDRYLVAGQMPLDVTPEPDLAVVDDSAPRKGTGRGPVRSGR